MIFNTKQCCLIVPNVCQHLLSSCVWVECVC